MVAGTNLGYLSILPRFEYLAPGTIEQACSLLVQHRGNVKVLAGGTDLLVSMKNRKVCPRYVVSIKDIPHLDCIEHSPQDSLKIGVRTTLQAIADNAIVRDRFGLLATACSKVGSLQVRNMGTIGGNICNGGPSQDTIPSLLVLDARLKLVSNEGERIVPINTFFTGPFQTILGEAELLTEIQIPALPSKTAGCYHWLTKITTKGETLVGVAVLVTADPSGELCQEIRIGLGSVAPTPIRAKEAEGLVRGKKIDDGLIEQAARVATGETSPRSRAEYRRRMTSLLVRRAISEAWGNIK